VKRINRSGRHSTTFKHSLLTAALTIAFSPPASASAYLWSAGNLSSSGVPSTLSMADVLTIGAGATKFVDTGLGNPATVHWNDSLYITGSNTISNSGSWIAGSNASLNGSASGSFINSGTFSAGTHPVAVSVSWKNSGTINTDAGGSIQFTSISTSFASGTRFTGDGRIYVANGASFSGAIRSDNLVLSSGTYTGNNAFISGVVDWKTGSLAGNWIVDYDGTLALQSGDTKYLNGTLSNLGTIAALDSFYLGNGGRLINRSFYDLQDNITMTRSGSTGVFTNEGTLRKSGGGGTATVSGITFVNNGVIDVQSGTLDFAGGSLQFNAGTRLSGSGRVTVTGNASFAGEITTADNFWLGNNATFTGSGAALYGTPHWVTGTLAGNWSIPEISTLTLETGNAKSINGTLSNRGTIVARDTLYLRNGGTLSNESPYALYDMQGDFAITNSGSSGNFVNVGTLRKSAGNGSATVSGITFSNLGEINVQYGTLNFASGTLLFNDGTRVTGGGQMAVTGNATFFGSLTAANNLTLSNGIFNGFDAALHGKANWASGTLVGVWEIAYPDTTLTLQPGNAKRLSGTLYNQGTIAAKDALYLRDGSTLVNGSLYDLQGDLAITNNESSGTFSNYGALRKSSGNGSATVSGVTFDNNGEINVQSGAVNFASGTLLFNDGTRFTGGGQVAVTGNATFAGSITANDLTLGNNARFTGNNATLHGNAHWASGTLARNWSIAKGTTVTLPSGNAKNLDGMLINQGTIAAQDTLQLGFGSSLDNQSTYQLQGDVGIQGPWGGAVVNSGTLTKTAGNGTSSLSAIALLLNTGVIDVHTGTIALPSDFTNVGTLKGAGAYKTKLLINAGHVAPGATGSAPSLLTLNGNYMQATTGSFDIGLQDPYHFGSLTVAGTATLDGVLAVSCVGACSFAVGTEFLILASMGTRSGSFSSLVMNGFSSGAFNVVYKGNEVYLDVTQKTVAAVPENETWAMLLAGLGLMGIVARRRRG
jgi:cytoskeletal protein CcmA (bactofilin family)